MRIAILAIILATSVVLCNTYPFPKEEEDEKESMNDALIAALYAVAQSYQEAENQAGGFQIGEAIVSTGASTDPGCKNYVGKKATGRYNSCDHAGCTEAKNRARENLYLGIPQTCRRYVQTNTPCKKYHCP